MKKVERYRKREVISRVSLPASLTFDSVYTRSPSKIWDTIHLIAPRRAARSIDLMIVRDDREFEMS